MSPFTIRRQINFEWVLTAILKLTIPEGWYQSKWYIQLQIKKSSGSPEGHFNTFKVLKYFWKCVQCRRSFITSVIIKAKRYWALKAYQTHYAKHFLLNPPILKTTSSVGSTLAILQMRKLKQNGHRTPCPRKHNQNLNPGILKREPFLF